jgi:hypothetical protein
MFQTDTLQNFTKYSVFEKSLFGGPAPGTQNALGINISNNLEAKMRKSTDTGFVYNKVTLLQNLSAGTSYNMAADSFRMADISLTARTTLFKHFDVVASSLFDPYAYDKVTDRRLSSFSYEYNGRVARFKSALFAVTTSLGSNTIETMRKKRNPDYTNGVERGAVKDLDNGEKLAWNIFINYGLTLTNDKDRVIQPAQTMNFSGDIMPTKYWKIGLTSGYDFTRKKLSYTSINLYRDLKCWEARIDWVPFGINKSYRLAINLKSSMLRDFKIPRQRQWYDNF